MATIRPCTVGNKTMYRVTYEDETIDFDFLAAATLYCIIDLGVDWVEVTG